MITDNSNATALKSFCTDSTSFHESFDPRIFNLTFSFFQQAYFQQKILLLHAPINVYNCNVTVYQNPPTMSTAPVDKNRKPLKKRHRVVE